MGRVMMTEAYVPVADYGKYYGEMVDRFGDDLLDGVNMLVMLMQGTPMTYYGDEIGMVDGTQQFDSDPEKRQNYRTLMQWTSEQDAGINVEDRMGRDNSHLAVFKYLAKMRHQEAILFGETEF